MLLATMKWAVPTPTRVAPSCQPTSKLLPQGNARRPAPKGGIRCHIPRVLARARRSGPEPRQRPHAVPMRILAACGAHHAEPKPDDGRIFPEPPKSAWEPQKLAVHAVLDAFHRGAHLKASPLIVCDLSLKKKKKKDKAETALGSASLSDLAPPDLARARGARNFLKGLEAPEELGARGRGEVAWRQGAKKAYSIFGAVKLLKSDGRWEGEWGVLEAVCKESIFPKVVQLLRSGGAEERSVVVGCRVQEGDEGSSPPGAI
ncbi:hypothetical protein CYMTET_17923 [Cymbomonas tetramitiformis]|uniref:Uncharacterized protein n=1 Tax=Cymbomonas tetramitiformis TaxID=36881 RepID=A0AAE0G948_9CHLO|nr:hypothetical protein CYMTET_17923 [Cymbomonas tetramitiformis]